MSRDGVLTRGVLLLGLVFHKAVWEVLKGASPAAAAPRPARVAPGLRLLKGAKVAVLAFLGLQTLFLTVLPISRCPAPLRAVGLWLYLLGLLTAVLGRVQLGKNWANLEDAQVLPEQRVVSHGLYRYIRHPIYTGDLLLVAGLQLALNSWLVLGVLALVPVVLRRAKAEERLLARTLPEYGAYTRRTKRFVPFIY